MPLNDEEKERVRYHLGYPETQVQASISFGIPRPIQTAFLVENAMTNLIENATNRVRKILHIMDDIEEQLVQAQPRLAAIKLGDLTLREDEPGQLEREYVRWGQRLAGILGVPVYYYSEKYQRAMGVRLGSVPVRS